MRKILADARPQSPDLIDGRLDAGHPLDIFEVLVDIVPQLHCRLQGRPAPGIDGTYGLDDFRERFESLLFQEIDIRHLPANLLEQGPLCIRGRRVIDWRPWFRDNFYLRIDHEHSMRLGMTE